MVSRRDVLRTGGAALAAALAGCQGPGDDPPTSTTTTPTTSDPPADSPRLEATEVAPREVPDGEPVVVASETLHDLVVRASAADRRVDAPRDLRLDPEARLALGDFRYLRFRGETYAADASFAGYLQETTYQYEAVPVNGSAVEDGEPLLEYGALDDPERAVADAMLNDTYSVGVHEERPPSALTFESQSYLRAGNQTYRVRVVHGDTAAHHMLSLSPEPPQPDVAVPTIADRAPTLDATIVLRDAVTDSPVALDDAEDAVRAYLDGADYVVTASAVAEVRVVDAAE